ncbi:CC0125/CC1285 family lipoprotein [Variovorax guangxiensis]|uniref:CC0125/CC1285 family lipoprotein n=1 Tax=Variovorax guangxiensis TaxID=1775474 RepID=UPI0040633DBA
MISSARPLLAAAVAGSALLSGCNSLPPTPYRAAPPGDGTYGYSTMHIEGDIYRIDFYGSPATASRTAKAFAFYRAAELAGELGAPAFRIVQGEVDRSILDGTEVFSWSDSFPEQPLGRLAASRESGTNVATLQKVAGTTYIPVPIYITPPGQAQRDYNEKRVSKLTILRAQMLRELPASLDDSTFLTREVLNKLGPRIVRAKSA